MPKAAKATTKTDFQRYVNDHPTVVPWWSKFHEQYKATPHKQSGDGLFGFWMRVKFPDKFDTAYRRLWLKRPDLHDKVYEDVVQEFEGPARAAEFAVLS